MARFEHETSTPSLFSWLTIITLGANLDLRRLKVVSSDDSVESSIWLTLPLNASYFALKAALVALAASACPLISSYWPSSTSSTSFLAINLDLIAASGASRYKTKSGRSILSAKARNWSAFLCEKPSNKNFYCELVDLWLAIRFRTSSSTLSVGTSPSNGSSSVPRVALTFSDNYFISMRTIPFSARFLAIVVLPERTCPTTTPYDTLFPSFWLKSEKSHSPIVLSLNSFWNIESML